MEREDKRGIFFGVIGVLTLIVAIIGASLAYFSINAKSETDALTVQAATVKIVYKDGDKLDASGLIPSTREIALRTLTRAGKTYGDNQIYKACIDDKGFTVCGYYDFTLTNGGPNPMEVTAKVTPSELAEDAVQFTNLKFALYDRSSVDDKEGTGMYNNGTELYTGTVSYSEFSLLGATGDETLEIAGDNTVKNLRLFVWIDEADDANDDEQGAMFKGTVEINVPGVKGGIITGTAEE